MNRRNFLKRAATGAAAVAVVAIPVTKVPVDDSFPETEEAMRKLMKSLGPAKYRPEGAMIPEGLCATITPSSTFWYYHKGDRIAVLHERPSDDHVCFEVQTVKNDKPKYYPPLNNGKAI